MADDLTPVERKPDFLRDGGTSGERMRAFDWSRTPLGPPEVWPAALKMATRLMLTTRHPVSIFWGPETIYLHNAAAGAFLGEDRRATALGRPAAAVWSETWSDRVAPQVAQILSGGEATWREDSHAPILRNGRLEDAWWTYSYSPIDDETAPAGVGGVLVIATETTRQVLARREFEAGRARLGALFEQAPGFIATLRGAEHIFDFVNAEHRRLFGSGDWIGKTARAVFADLAGQGYDDLLDHVYRTGERRLAYAAPFQFRVGGTGEPEVRFLDFLAAPIRNADGEVTGLYTQGQDVTERVRAQAALGESEARFRALAETIPAILFITDRDGANVYTNPPYHRFSGMTSDDLKGDGWVASVHPEDRERAAASWEASWRFGVPYDIEFRFRRHDGVHRWHSVRGTPVRDGDRVTGWVGVGVDIHQQKAAEEALRALNASLEARVSQAVAERLQAEAALRQAQKMEAIGQLTGGVAHDFNNLLTPIMGALDMLDRRGVGAERDRRLINGALQSAERARTLVQRLLAFARRQPLDPKPVDVGELIAGMTDLIASTLGPQVRLSIEIEPGLPPALADANQFEMALLNLGVNARDAMPGGGVLTLAVHLCEVAVGEHTDLPRGEYICVKVTDTGVGMDDETRSRAIEPFFSTKAVGQGTGLGLSMVDGLVRQLGGAVAIHSEPGEGTAITLWLPLAEAVADPAPPARAGAVSRVFSGTLLLVDDDALVRGATAQMIESFGYTVVEARSGEAALAMIDAGLRPDLMVTDQLMDGMTGDALARAARHRLPNLPVLVISGYADMDALSPDLPRLAKPFRAEALAQALASVRGREKA